MMEDVFHVLNVTSEASSSSEQDRELRPEEMDGESLRL